MGRQTADDVSAKADEARNCVELCGRVTSTPVIRELPSGDEIVTFRLSVPRPGDGPSGRSGSVSGSGSRRTGAAGRAGSDWVDCVAWGARERRAVRAWVAGDRVLVTGALRRRFYGAGPEKGTRLEVAVTRVRRTARAA
jgi:single-strand DNA-binding protein